VIGRRFPLQVRDLPSLLPGERPIAWSRGGLVDAADTGFVVATDRALHLVQDGVPERRIPWDRIEQVRWDEPVLDLTVRERRGERSRRWRIALEEPGDLPVAVRERVVASIVIQQHVQLSTEGGARVVARRGADDGVVRWSVVFDPGMDAGDPRWRTAVDAVLAELRGHVG
jgi:hypothetical protein